MISTHGMEVLRAQLQRHEGLRLNLYADLGGKTTVGYGRNLSANGISVDEALLMLENDIEKANLQLEGLPWFDGLSEARRIVIVNMCFNMGLAGVLGFTKMIYAIETGSWEDAAQEMLASKWATQVGKRAKELAEIMESGLLI